ncbi:translation initiation factor IF-3 [Chitinophaga pinensis]|uniref:Translation initiation factor IF-3 n=1 Tax=Chitinophaga pinensis (strain ATCC 43595 / DSM 2588 / LMG 13176 / NBRC 15968 / NCIMB 11800 / UQM 2034) TaxID=485918 RepID=A0A979GXI7_CHIPD|nr:translation initiation factor IF-3 [Chitinophaga pinensis]ACU61205.1 translation initiation factor IF-3 [Chitinophaga pinensis DSM 2588]
MPQGPRPSFNSNNPNRGRNPNFRREQQQEHRTNRMIRVPEVRLVGENIEVGVYRTEEALRMAEEQGLDLVEISPNAVPPVCRIIDYNKFLYEKKKKEKEMKAKAHKSEVKEIRFTPNTDDHDFDFKAKHAEKFLKDGNKVKTYVQFKGRAIMFKERGELILLKFAERLAEVGALEGMPTMEGKRMIAIFAPKSAKKKSDGGKEDRPKEDRPKDDRPREDRPQQPREPRPAPTPSEGKPE